jgi:hypothetical protein
VLHCNTRGRWKAADPQRLFIIVLVAVVIAIAIVGLADGRFVVVIVARAADASGSTRVEQVQALSYGGGMRSTWPG